MSDKDNKNEPQLLLRVSTLGGVIYEQHVFSLKINRKDGVMVINQFYSTVMEQLADGEIAIQEKNKKVYLTLSRGWLTVGNNRCNVYASEAHIVNK